jgi:hypothetical protein
LYKRAGGQKTNSSTLLILPFLLILGIVSTTDAFSQSSPDFGLKRSDEIIKVEQNYNSNYPGQLTISTKSGFDSSIKLKVSVEPPTKFVEVKINGQVSPTVDTKKGPPSLDLTVGTDDRAPPGDYKITVTATSTVKGKEITRIQSFIVKIIPPKEFSMEVKPSKITIPQGGSGSVNVKTHLKTLLSDTFRLYATFPISGLTVSISGDGEFVHFPNGYESDWLLPPEKGKQFNTKFQIKASPKTPPGKYTVNMVGQMDYSSEATSSYEKYTIPVYVTVTKDPKFSNLQKPALFDITPEFHKMKISPGSIGYNDISIWSERPDEQITFDVSVSPSGQGLAADMNKKTIIPKSPPPLGSFVIVAVSEDAKPGTYKIAITGTTHTLAGKELEQVTEFEVDVPKKKTSVPDLVVKSTSIKHDGTYFVFTWFFEDVKKHPVIGDTTNSHLTLDYVVQVTEGSGRPYEQHVSGTAKQLSVSVIDSGKNLEVSSPEKISNPDNANSALFDTVKGAKPLAVKGQSLKPLVIKPPKITSNDQWKYVASVFIIDGHAYPREQFIKTTPNTCVYDHYVTKSGYAISLDLRVLADPSPSGCRFGPTHFQNPSGEYATKTQILTWEKVTGISIKADDYD